MPATLDHLIVPARQREASARFYADVLGFRYKGASENDNIAVKVNDTLTLLFHEAEQPQSVHMAFRFSEEELDALLGRMQQRGVPYGSHARDRENGRTDHMWGCRGVYFLDPDGHSVEVVTGSRPPASASNS